MEEKLININKTGKVPNFAAKTDMRKAYRIFLMTVIGAVIFTTTQYFIYTNII